MLTKEERSFYEEHGYLHIPKVFTEEETNELAAELELPDAAAVLAGGRVLAAVLPGVINDDADVITLFPPKLDSSVLN